jgi:regulator of extracellular matrix RemA (YlzA/DUF370 family)
MKVKWKRNLSPVMVNVGFGNYLAAEKVVAVVSPAGAPMKRLRDEARESGLLVDATEGRRTRSIVIMESGQVVLSALLAETVTERLSAERQGDDEPARASE